MKRIILLVFAVIVLSVQLISQSIFVNHDHRVSRITDIVSLDDSTYVQALILGLDDQPGLIQWIKNDVVLKSLEIENYVNNIQLRTANDSLFADI